MNLKFKMKEISYKSNAAEKGNKGRMIIITCRINIEYTRFCLGTDVIAAPAQ